MEGFAVGFLSKLFVRQDPFKQQKIDLAPLRGYEVDDIIVQAVQAYLSTHNLNEDDVKPGLFIPWSSRRMWGTAQATAEKGPKGHKVYAIQGYTTIGSQDANLHSRRLEIQPAPTSESSPTVIVEGWRSWGLDFD